MEEKKNISNNLLVFFLILCIIVITVLGVYIYKINAKLLEITNTSSAKDNTFVSNTTDNSTTGLEILNKISNDTNTAKTNNTTNETNTSSNTSIATNISNENLTTSNANSEISFEKMMNILYPHSETKKDSTTYYSTVSDFDRSYDGSPVGYTNVYIDQNGINLYIYDESHNISTTIKGITEEVVDIKLKILEPDSYPQLIVLLTRNGNVYYLKDFSGDMQAQKIDDLSEIVKISIMESYTDGAYHTDTDVVGIDKDGDLISLWEYIYKQR